MSSAQHPVYSRPQFADSNVPLPTSKAPPVRTPTRSGPSLRRGKTLTRPERSVAPAPLISAPAQAVAEQSSFSPWNVFSIAVTFWAPPAILSSLGGMKDSMVRQAWREKIALCLIALCIGGAVGFLTVGLDRTFCPSDAQLEVRRFVHLNSTAGTLGVQGWEFNITNSKTGPSVDFYALAKQLSGQDITAYFQRSASDYGSCQGHNFAAATDNPCPNAQTDCPLGPLSNSTFNSFQIQNTSLHIGYGWDQVSFLDNYLVLNGAVLDMSGYIKAHPTAVPNDSVDFAIRTLLQGNRTSGGKDGTRHFYSRPELLDAVPCLVERYSAGSIDKITPGCFVSNLILYAGLIVILGLVLVRFVMACIFNWFLSAELIKPPRNLSRRVVSPAVLAEGANIAVDNKTGVAPWAAKDARRRQQHEKGGTMSLFASTNGISPTPRSRTMSLAPSHSDLGTIDLARTMSAAAIGAELYTICLVTCYSEGEDSLRTTLDSIANTQYSDERKLLFVVADGLVTGAGEKKSTPEIAKSLLERDLRFGDPVPCSYIAVGSGSKKENMAEVWAGYYTVTGRRTPMVLVIKCGTEGERKKDKKPGNRGKRDSQLVLMNFFSRVTYNDRMTPLDYDLFRKMTGLMGVTPDYFEACLMVDADTKVFPDSLTHLINSLHHDEYIMGVCGETRIANKRQSWVTMIQVYEYFIAHHMAKAFESVFGGVTCLPGCFSLYRLKARKAHEDDWVPLIVHPDIVREYSQSEVVTLHEKNLLLLGEDRFLTTILLRTFPNRKMMFIPQARCRTVAPDSFKVLLSQRRRWINSTVHNLMELVQVRNLCGTFCFSMQFVVFMDLIGTVTLPVAICLTYSLIVTLALHPPHTFEAAIPLILLVTVVFLPGVLILITTGKIIYVAWMFIYLVALPIWNFVLPVYSFWHFDDFSWGETRKVVGELKGEGHGTDTGAVAAAQVPLRRWEDWERSRQKKEARDRKRRERLERNFPGGFYNGEGGDNSRLGEEDARNNYDAASMVSSVDEDKWGGHIGVYDEYGAPLPSAPPQTLLRPNSQLLENAKTVNMDELEAMLDHGFDPNLPSSPLETPTSSYHKLPPVPPLDRSRYPLPAGQPEMRLAPMQTHDVTYARVAPGSPGPTSSGELEPRGVSSALGASNHLHVRRRSGGAERDDWGPMGPLGDTSQGDAVKSSARRL